MSDQKSALARAKAPAQAKQSRLAALTTGSRVYVPWRIPRLNADAEITLVPHDKGLSAEAATEQLLGSDGLKLNPYAPNWRHERAARLAAYAVVVPVSREPFGTVDEWRALDADILEDFQSAYEDLRAAWDPTETPLSGEEVAVLVEALKKKDPRLLRLFGARRLSSYLLTTADQQLALLEPKSESGESSPESSPSPEPSPPEAETPATSSTPTP